MKPGERFSSRVDDYQKYRPDYPQSLVTEIIKQSGLDDSAVIADFGSGTGIFTRRLLQAGFEVYAVEPNREMRVAAESALAAEPGFTSIDGSAEDSRLESASIDLITAAQAFHWFNTDTAKQEFRRVLKPQGQLALIWNKRKLSQPFQQAYDAILREFAPEYGKVNHMNLSEMDIQGFFATGAMRANCYRQFAAAGFCRAAGAIEIVLLLPRGKLASIHSTGDGTPVVIRPVRDRWQDRV